MHRWLALSLCLCTVAGCSRAGFEALRASSDAGGDHLADASAEASVDAAKDAPSPDQNPSPACSGLLPGSLDPSFAGGGLGRFEVSAATSDVSTELAIDGRGRIVVAGHGQAGFASNAFFALRLVENGTLDASFGKGGVSARDVGPENDTVEAMAIDAQDGVLIGGRSQQSNGFAAAIVRLSATGTIDSSFGQNGQVTIFPLDSSDHYILDLAIDDQNRIIAAGRIDSPSFQILPFAMRLRQNGTLDLAFGAAGSYVGASQGVVHALLPEASTIFAVGTQGGGFVFWRFEPNGSVAKGTPIRIGLATTGTSIDLVADNNTLLLTGWDSDSATVARVDKQGSPASGWGNNGVVSLETTGRPWSIAVDGKDRILLAGSFAPPTAGDTVFVARLTPDGQLDTTFGQNGIQGLKPGDNSHPTLGTELRGIAIDGRGGILTNGWASFGGRTEVVVMRLCP
jgi:uncharacterized delta-60 repeat protein